MFMGTKTITIMDDAYELLKSRKRKDESFSAVLRREIGKSKKPLTDFAGRWKDTPEIRKIFDDILERRHNKKWRGTY